VGIVLPYRGPLRQAMKRFKRGWRKWRADVHLVSYPKCGRTWLVLLIVRIDARIGRAVLRTFWL